MAEFPLPPPTSLPPVVIPPGGGGPVAASGIRGLLARIAPTVIFLWSQSWPGRVVTWVFYVISLKAVFDWVWEWGSSVAGHINAIVFWRQPDAWVEGWKHWMSMNPNQDNQLGKVMHTIFSSFAGFPVDEKTIQQVMDGEVRQEDLQNFAGVFRKAIEDVFDVKKVAQGYFERLPGDAERDNFRQFIALHARLQMGMALANLTKDSLAFGVGQGITAVTKAMEALLGLEDAQEEILEPLMEKMIVEGMTKKFNREILPVDLTPSDATAARIRGYIDQDTFKKILDNEGIRYGVRETLKKLRANNLSQADIQERYNQGLTQGTEVFDFFRQTGYLEEDATLKENLVINDRLWKLQAELTNVREQQFVRGVISEPDFRNHLQTQNYNQDEEDVQVLISLAKRTLGTSGKPKAITGSFNIVPERVKPGQNAIIKWNIRNADEITITDLGSVPARGEQPLVVTASKTYLLTARSDTDEETFPAYVELKGEVEEKLPRVSLTVSPQRGTLGSLRELRWSVSNSDSVSIDGFGAVPEQGVQFVFPILPTFYTLRAANKAGTVSIQDVALVELPEFGLPEPNKPRISFSITPGVVTLDQPRSELKWETTQSKNQYLIDPDGNREDIPAAGARIITVARSGVYTVRAENDFGATERQEAVILKSNELL